jgi:hypothetical protein
MSDKKYTKQQLIDALIHEYDYLIHDDFDPEVDDTVEEYQLKLECYSLEDLIKETSTGEYYTLDEFMENHG